MAIEDFIEETPVFRLEELRAACGDTQANTNLLSRAVKAGKVRRVKSGVYASNAGRYKGTRPDKFSVAAALAPDACLCGLSALSFFAGEHNITFSASFYSNTLRNPVEFDGVEYVPRPYPSYGVETRTKRLKSGAIALMTSKEQSIVDALHRPSRHLGAEAILRTLSAIMRVDEESLASIASKMPASTRAKTGWVMERRSGDWNIDGGVIARMKESLGAGPYYFDGKGRPEGSFDPEWRLYFPEPLETVEEWLRG